MVTLEQIKAMIIKEETEWLIEVHDDNEAPMYILGMKDEINECESIGDIVDFYLNRGMDLYETADKIVSLLRNNCIVKE
jgi:hypothetical protein